MIRRLMIAVVAVMATSVAVGAGTAAAERPLPHVAMWSDNIPTFGDHDFCRGAFNVGIQAPKGTRGVARLVLRSHGFTGSGPGWKRNPTCTFRVLAGHLSGNAMVRETWFRVGFGPRPGQTLMRDIRTGSGPVAISIGTFSSRSPVLAQQGYGATLFTVVP